jgi:hypothetical protein
MRCYSLTIQTDAHLYADSPAVPAIATHFCVRYLLRAMPGWYDHLLRLGSPGFIREKDDSGVFLRHASSVGLKPEFMASTNSVESLIIMIAFRLASFNTAGLTTNLMFLEDKVHCVDPNRAQLFCHGSHDP